MTLDTSRNLVDVLPKKRCVLCLIAWSVEGADNALGGLICE